MDQKVSHARQRAHLNDVNRCTLSHGAVQVERYGYKHFVRVCKHAVCDAAKIGWSLIMQNKSSRCMHLSGLTTVTGYNWESDHLSWSLTQLCYTGTQNHARCIQSEISPQCMVAARRNEGQWKSSPCTPILSALKNHTVTAIL